MVFPDSKVRPGTARVDRTLKPVEVNDSPARELPSLQYQRFRGRLCRGWTHVDLDPTPDFLDHPEQVATRPEAEKIVDRVSRQIYRLPLTVGGEQVACYSYYLADTSFLRVFRPTYAFRVLKQSRRLLENGIGTFQVLASVKRKGVFLNRCSFVLVREIPCVTEIASRSNYSSEIHDYTDLTAELAASLGAAVADLHNKGFIHGDLKSRHVLLRETRTPEIFFVDLEKCWSVQPLPGLIQDLLCARDLIQLVTSMPENKFYRTEVRKELLGAYWAQRQLPGQRNERILGYLNMYGPGGGFRQGKTLLQNVVSGLSSMKRGPKIDD